MSKVDTGELMRESEDLIKELWPAIKGAMGGRRPEVQGAVLADLMAMWIAGYVVRGDLVKTIELREAMLTLQIDTIRVLIEHYDLLAQGQAELAGEGHDNLRHDHLPRSPERQG